MRAKLFSCLDLDLSFPNRTSENSENCYYADIYFIVKMNFYRDFELEGEMIHDHANLHQF